MFITHFKQNLFLNERILLTRMQKTAYSYASFNHSHVVRIKLGDQLIENFGYCKKSSFAFFNQISCCWYCVLYGKHHAFVCMLNVVIKPAWLTRANQNQKMKLLVAFLASAFAEEPLQRSRRQVNLLNIFALSTTT